MKVAVLLPVLVKQLALTRMWSDDCANAPRCIELHKDADDHVLFLRVVAESRIARLASRNNEIAGE